MKASLRNNAEQEFSFLISPPTPIKKAIFLLKEDIQTAIGHELDDRYTLAHISLFKCGRKNIENIIQNALSKAAYFKPFNIFLKDFNVFHHGSNRTIYLEIINKYFIRDIFKNLTSKDASFTPHITLIKNVDMEDFQKAWSYLNDFSYSQYFLCDRITVLERGETQWLHYRDILFKGPR